MQYSPAEFARGALGALIGIASAGLVARLAPGGSDLLPFLVAPMGASAVLLFSVPASPLAQPWSVLGGNLISTVIGLIAHFLIPDVLLAAAVGVAVAIGTMMALRCLHPPGGACALLAATATPEIADESILFVVVPVAANTVVLLLTAIAVNNLTGRPYPHRVAPAPATGAAEKLSIDASDVESALAHLARTAQRLDVLPGDVIALVREAEDRALDRRLGSLPVREIMHTDPAVAHPFESIYRVRTQMIQREVKTLPIVDAETRVVGVVSIIDLFSRDLVELETVETIMHRDVVSVGADEPVASLVGLMTQDGYKNLPVVDGDGRLVGMLTRGDLLAVLHRALLRGDAG